MARKIVLCSGGFDSAVLMYTNELECTNEERNIALFFDYAQANALQERQCALNLCNKLGFEFREIIIPDFNWSNSTLRTGDVKDDIDQYVEMRNLVFLSYAVSVAETEGIKDIYMAILKSNLGFKDTSPEFVKGFNEFMSPFGITLHTPFIEYTKVDLAFAARQAELKKDEFFSCNTPVNGKPCGKCGDCNSIDYVYKEIIEDNIPVKAWLTNYLEPSDKFDYLFRKEPITELRLLINNDCQFQCSHCFYGFDGMKSNPLTLKQRLKAIDDFVECGVTNIHFSGKEPFYDDYIFDYCQYLRDNHPHVTFDVVTNGVNVLRYKKEIIRAKFSKIYLSVDSMYDLTIRPTAKHMTGVFEFLRDTEIKTQVFIDTHKNNYIEVPSMITFLNKEYGIKEFFVRPIQPVGSGEKLSHLICSSQDFDEVFNNLSTLKGDFNIEFSIKNPWVDEYLKGGYFISESLETLVLSGCNRVGQINLFPEFYCSRFENQVTLTPDGYVLGCGTEVSSPDYDRISVGNIRDHKISELLEMGKETSLAYINKCLMRGCPHHGYKINTEDLLIK